MRNAGTERGDRQTSMAYAADVSVHEKGSPRACHRSLGEHLGRRILVATDLGPSSVRVEARALDLAAHAGSHLIILAITSTLQASAADTARLADLVRRARERGIDSEAHVTFGDPADIIVRVADSSGADAVILGDGQWQHWGRARAVCGHVARRSPCPVLITHAPGAP